MKSPFGEHNCPKHYNKILLICLNKQCSTNRLCCFGCIDNEHVKHDIISLKKFEEIMKEDLQNLNQNLHKGKIFNLLEQTEHQLLKSLKKVENYFMSVLNKIEATICNNFAKAYRQFKIGSHSQLMEELCNNFQLQRFDDIIESIKNCQKYQFGTAKQTDLLLSRQIFIFKKKCEEFNTDLEKKMKGIEEITEKIDLSSHANSEGLFFHQTYKYMDMKIIDTKNIVSKTSQSGGRNIALVNRPLTPVNPFCAFKILSNGNGFPSISLGAAILPIVRKNNFTNCTGFNKGVYAIDQSSNSSWGSLQQSQQAISWNHSHQNLCNTPVSFQICQGDIITIEIDYQMHTIIFERNDDIFEMEIDALHKQLYPYVGMVNKDTMVQIIE